MMITTCLILLRAIASSLLPETGTAAWSCAPEAGAVDPHAAIRHMAMRRIPTRFNFRIPSPLPDNKNEPGRLLCQGLKWQKHPATAPGGRLLPPEKMWNIMTACISLARQAASSLTGHASMLADLKARARALKT